MAQIEINGSFENGWKTLPPTGNAGFLRNQEPNQWALEILLPGSLLWDSNDEVKGEPECVHKLENQLPPNERPGGLDPLILDGTTTYKIFHSGASFGAKLSQTIEGLKPGTQAKFSMNIRCHKPKSDGDIYEAEFRLQTNGAGGWWNGSKLKHRRWVNRTQERTIGEDGKFTIEIYVKSKWARPIDFFMDNFKLTAVYDDSEPEPPEPPEPPADDLEQRVEALERAILELEQRETEQDKLLASLTRQIDVVTAETVRLNSLCADLDMRVLKLENEDPTPPVNPNIGYRDLGVDVSAHQGTFDWSSAVLNGVKFGIIRSSNGLGSSTTDEYGYDLELFRNAERCNRLGIPFSIYHFLQPGNIIEQANLVNEIYSSLLRRETAVSPGVLHDGTELPPVFVDVELSELTPNAIKAFCDGLLVPYGFYSRKNLWDSIMGNTAVWWKDRVSWVAAYGSNDGRVPPAGKKPPVMYGFEKSDVWQFTSLGGSLVGWGSKSLDVNLAGPFITDEPEPPDPPGDIYDLLDYMRGDGRLFELQLYDVNGNPTNQERNQTQTDPVSTNDFYIVKGENQGCFEEWAFDQREIFLVMDTSPSKADDGTERFYRVTKSPGNPILSAWAKRFMRIGESVSDGGHYVQFYDKSDCSPHPQNSGFSANRTELIAHYDAIRFPETAVTVNDVIEIRSGVETHWFAKGLGRVRWSSPWGKAVISELHPPGQRPDIVRETNFCW
jgi:hypothetical protein